MCFHGSHVCVHAHTKKAKKIRAQTVRTPCSGQGIKSTTSLQVTKSHCAVSAVDGVMVKARHQLSSDPGVLALQILFGERFAAGISFKMIQSVLVLFCLTLYKLMSVHALCPVFSVCILKQVTDPRLLPS